ncbi:MAG: histidinol phosphate phosphatase domain-containing protein [Candidatus Adiutrix sp.]|jgi:histidinol phosphatase-like PHP family hydrolase|nr:histidinol phosphate phosphatase domain-containing protein [Candidatus Adiutrix sp.]
MDAPAVIDFHTHSLLSDGALVPAELARRVQVAGYRVLGLADHVDHGTLEGTLIKARASALALNGSLGDLLVLPGVEITHVPPPLIGGLIARARELGASHVVVHGESLAEPVAPGTNRAAIEAGADILAHPGLLSEEEAALAAECGVYLEISGRQGHCLTNGLVVKLARRQGAKMLINSDGHAPGDFYNPGGQRAVALGAGLDDDEYLGLMRHAALLAETFRQRLYGPL